MVETTPRMVRPYPWADFYSTGLVDAERAEKWGLEVYGSRANYDDCY